MKLKGDETMNKYQEALNALCDEDEMYKLAKGFSFDDDYTSEYDYEKAKEYCKNKIQELANNPPLKFEDLHKGMWIWDDKTKSYIYIFKPLDWKPVKGIRYASHIITNSVEGYYMDFEENRFYRREVPQEGQENE